MFQEKPALEAGFFIARHPALLRVFARFFRCHEVHESGPKPPGFDPPLLSLALTCGHRPHAGGVHRVQWLDKEQRRLVRMRAKRYGWRDITIRFACDRSTAWRRWQAALAAVSKRLTAKRT